MNNISLENRLPHNKTKNIQNVIDDHTGQDLIEGILFVIFILPALEFVRSYIMNICRGKVYVDEPFDSTADTEYE